MLPSGDTPQVDFGGITHYIQALRQQDNLRVKVIKVKMFTDSVIPFTQTNLGCQERDLSSPMVPLLTTERRS
ncbi:hypothetical protein HanXRQr2_Chr17g0823181 [Helianthus annuus]|uniref:Uncharacterized protein n=1 Tax=Helianthus annuus TaxID=4232 RepID=A0A9K3DLD3_HELAN|nr:hypothetical protein HanXRQr2_Chr17g0823181 [Helianthus annuus]